MKRVVVLGATGSIGRQTLDIVRDHPGAFRVVALAARASVDQVVEAARTFRPEAVALSDEEAARRAAGLLEPLGIQVLAGPAGVEAAAAWPGADVVVSGIMGFAGLPPTLAAIRAGRTVVLANKETLVAAGPLVMAEARRWGARLLPADSEHNAIHQCLAGLRREDVRRIWLTASGGPFRGWTPERLDKVTPEAAVAHPNWQMGPKISVDSATLMNKGLEIIEAMHLFELPAQRIGVLVHPQSLVHGLVELVDGGLIAHMAAADMRLPLGYCLAYPQRLERAYGRLDLVRVGSLTFEEPDRETFPCLRLAEDAARIGGTMPAVLNAANEVAVTAFLRRQIGFRAIAHVVASVMDAHDPVPIRTLDDVLAADAWARRRAQQVVTELGG